MLMYQEEFQRPLELFHQLILTIFNNFNGLFLFSISHLEDVNVITKTFFLFFPIGRKISIGDTIE